MIFDNLSKDYREALPDDAGFIQGDLLDAGKLTRVQDAGFDGVLHFAALRGASLVGSLSSSRSATTRPTSWERFTRIIHGLPLQGSATAAEGVSRSQMQFHASSWPPYRRS